MAGLVQGSDGNFYGTTYSGGTGTNCIIADGTSSGCGTVYRISPSGDYTNLYSFGNTPNDGNSPQAGLVQGNDGNFYGTTYSGGSSGYGTVYKIGSSGTYTNLYSFTGDADGISPFGGLVQGSDGDFYGTTSAFGYSTVFRISPSGNYATLYRFGSSSYDGMSPEGTLVQGNDGSFYGTASEGGTSTNCPQGCGTLFEISPSGNYTNLYYFGNFPNDGITPEGALVQGTNGNFYGTTTGGGANNAGTVFILVVSGTNASITVMSNPPIGGTVSGGGTFAVGSLQQISASANSGWTFTGWSDGGVGTHSITVPANGAIFTANFEQSQSPVATPTITPAGGNFNDSVKVTMKCTTRKAVIYYTIDDTEPTINSRKYRSPFTLTNSATINAVAFLGANSQSATAVENYSIGTPTITTASELPDGNAFIEYSVQLQAAGGAAPYKWALATGSRLPAGLKLSREGAISGKPTTAETATITVKVTDAKRGVAEQSFTLTIYPAIQ